MDTRCVGSPAIMLLARAMPPSDPTRDDAMRKASSLGARDRICIQPMQNHKQVLAKASRTVHGIATATQLMHPLLLCCSVYSGSQTATSEADYTTPGLVV